MKKIVLKLATDETYELTTGLSNPVIPGVELQVSNDDDEFGIQIGTKQPLKVSLDGIFPSDDDTFDLGKSDKRFDDIYATNGTINTSDENRKEIQSFLETNGPFGIRFVEQLTPMTFKWKDYGEKTFTRHHFGLSAQQVEQVLIANDISTNEFAPFIKDIETDNYGLRYQEFIPILIQAIKDVAAENDALREEIQGLAERVSELGG